MTGTLGRRGSLPASPSRVEGCIFGLLSGVDVPVRVHQLLRSSLSFDEFGESRHVESKTILLDHILRYEIQPLPDCFDILNYLKHKPLT